MSTLKVAALQGLSASSDAITLANDGTCTANITNNLSNRRLTINGAMTIAQRGVSSTSTGYYTVDRFVASWGGTDEACTQEQVDIASGTTPYTLGFRKAFKITNGNQTSTDASDIVYYEHHIEAQNIANSGWNYTSSSSNITLSFWVKSSVSQDFKGYLRTADGTSQIYPYSTGTLSANTWTKITKTIPGNSNLQFDNNNESGLQLYLWPYIGTTYTDAGVTEHAWTAYASGTRTPVSATTWWTTNDATIEITGVQLEVGDHPTSFEFLSYGQELQLCKRYYQQYVNLMGAGIVPDNSSKSYNHGFNFPVEFRSTPSLTTTNTGSNGGQIITDGSTNASVTSLLSSLMNTESAHIDFNITADLVNFRPAMLGQPQSSTYNTTYKFSAEL